MKAARATMPLAGDRSSRNLSAHHEPTTASKISSCALLPKENPAVKAASTAAVSSPTSAPPSRRPRKKPQATAATVSSALRPLPFARSNCQALTASANTMEKMPGSGDGLATGGNGAPCRSFKVLTMASGQTQPRVRCCEIFRGAPVHLNPARPGARRGGRRHAPRTRASRRLRAPRAFPAPPR